MAVNQSSTLIKDLFTQVALPPFAGPAIPFTPIPLTDGAKPREVYMTNPAMDLRPGASRYDPAGVLQKWTAVYDALQRCGAEITIIEQSEDSTPTEQMIFPRDRAILLGDKAYVPHSASAHPRCYAPFHSFLEGEGYDVIKTLSPQWQGGNVRVDRQTQTIFWGYDSEEWELENLQEHTFPLIKETQDIDWNIVPVYLKDHRIALKNSSIDIPTIYHMDMGLSERLEGGELLFAPALTDEKTADTIREIIGRDNIIEIDRVNALNGAANLNFSGRNIVADIETPELVERGYQTITAAHYGLPSFEVRKGRTHCLTLERI
ncbi:MAG: hypothetical protein GC136_04800 [Alphaproteobacteria bacterium]|nr:hypothetical protein [Alphaproteobacteria bacterium]